MRDIILSEVPQFAKKASDKSKDAVIQYLREQVFPINFKLIINRLKKQLKKQIHNG
jgi:hypothetical protein